MKRKEQKVKILKKKPSNYIDNEPHIRKIDKIYQNVILSDIVQNITLNHKNNEITIEEKCHY